MNKRWISVIGLFLVLSTTIVAIGCGKNEPIATPYVSEEFVVCNASGNQAGPRISGDIIVWADYRDGAADIYGYNLSDRNEFPICTNSSSQDGPDIDGDIVAWWDARNVDYGSNWNSDIYGYNLSTKNEFVICNESHDQGGPSISGNIVVWLDERGDLDCGNYIYGSDLISSVQPEFPINTLPFTKLFPYISGETVVWTDFRNSNISCGQATTEGINLDIYGYNLSSSNEFPICINPSIQTQSAISGNIVVWEDGRNGDSDIYGYDLDTGNEFSICTVKGTQLNPAIHGDIVVWADYRNGNGDIYGYNLKTGEEFAICTDPGNQQSPSIYGNVVVWEDDRDEVADTYYAKPYDIYGARLTFDNP